MRTFFLIFAFLNSISSLAQKTLKDVEDKKIMARIVFIKAKTDSFLLSSFDKKIRSNFVLNFPSCGYYRGELHFLYQFLNSDQPNPSDINNSTHYYKFTDSNIGLNTEIGIYFYEYNGTETKFSTIGDSLMFDALNKLYNKGLVKKALEKISSLRLKNPYTVIEIDKSQKAYNIILKDKYLPHNFIIR